MPLSKSMHSNATDRRLFWVVLTLFTGPAMTPAQAQEMPPPAMERDLLRAGDELLIGLPGQDNLKATYFIDFHGNVRLPVVGLIRAEGIIVTELERSISVRLPNYLKGSTPVSAAVLSPNYFIRISGHVTNPGWYRVPVHYDIEQAIELAAGASDGAVMSEISLLRESEAGMITIPVNLFKYYSTGDRSLLPPLKQKDTIFIPRTARMGDVKRSLGNWFPPKSELEITVDDQIRVIGEVRRPSFIEHIRGANVLDMITLAGGSKGNADLTQVVVYRMVDGVQTRRVSNINAMLLSGRLDQIEKISAGDIIYVPAKGKNFAGRSWQVFKNNASTVSTLVLAATAIRQILVK
ncbi:MAG: SLBB domain-containing protein [Candidatus Marinimicrobia bacterium]|nr:SLBB domain-containing protein [Candidatus Neomarinimicrobiota bacterium]